MRKVAGVLALALLFALAPPDASAQAPSPKVTITGVIDAVTAYSRNTGGTVEDPTRVEKQWYSRQRGRFDVIGEIGKAKAVLGLELDIANGEVTAPEGGTQFTSCGNDLDNDVRGSNGCIEIKWMYVEFPLPSVPGTLRLGGQPWTATYKPFWLVGSDFGGANLDLDLTPNVKAHLTFGQFEEQSFGRNAVPNAFGEDWALIGSVEVTPFKGLDLRPIYAFFNAQGPSGRIGQSRRDVGGVRNNLAFFPNSAEEERHTVALDARWRSGPWSLDPTVAYQFGQRDLRARGVGPVVRQDMHAWFVDVTGGYQIGPLLLETRALYTTGNKAGDNLTGGADVNYYQPIHTGWAYWIGWGELNTISLIDYLSLADGLSASTAQQINIGYDRYGRAQLGVRATYAVTPSFRVTPYVTASWTAEQVDRSSSFLGTAVQGSLVPGDGRGDDRYLGTDVGTYVQWRFAPGLTFDASYGHLFPGPAQDRARVPGGPIFKAKDREIVTARVRFAF